VGIVCKRGKVEAAHAALELAQYLDRRGIETTVERETADAFGQVARPPVSLRACAAHEVPDGADLMVVLGGDGTLIFAAGLLSGRDVPIVGFNLGTLGFLTEFPRGELVSIVERTVDGLMPSERRAMLRVALVRDGVEVTRRDVLNDAVLNKGALARIGIFETRLDGALVTSYRSDGVIVSTPTGSTAYAMSAGGPLMYPTMDALLIAPICPHWLSHRPIVVPLECSVEVILRSHTEMYLTLDGQEGEPIRSGDRIVVQRSPSTLHLVVPRDRDFFSVLRAKLKWGAD
jgi:NAD+ kinase